MSEYVIKEQIPQLEASVQAGIQSKALLRDARASLIEDLRRRRRKVQPTLFRKLLQLYVGLELFVSARDIHNVRYWTTRLLYWHYSESKRHSTLRDVVESLIETFEDVVGHTESMHQQIMQLALEIREFRFSALQGLSHDIGTSSNKLGADLATVADGLEKQEQALSTAQEASQEAQDFLKRATKPFEMWPTASLAKRYMMLPRLFASGTLVVFSGVLTRREKWQKACDSALSEKARLEEEAVQLKIVEQRLGSLRDAHKSLELSISDLETQVGEDKVTVLEQFRMIKKLSVESEMFRFADRSQAPLALLNDLVGNVLSSSERQVSKKDDASPDRLANCLKASFRRGQQQQRASAVILREAYGHKLDFLGERDMDQGAQISIVEELFVLHGWRIKSLTLVLLCGMIAMIHQFYVGLVLICFSPLALPLGESVITHVQEVSLAMALMWNKVQQKVRPIWFSSVAMVTDIGDKISRFLNACKPWVVEILGLLIIFTGMWTIGPCTLLYRAFRPPITRRQQ